MLARPLPPLSVVWLATVLGGASAVAAPPTQRLPQREPRKGDPIAPAVESPSERRAVRGVPLEDTGLDESPELRDLRRFEEAAFPRSAGMPRDPDEAGGQAQLPPLPGRWRGTGNLPPELRTPEVSRRGVPAAAAPESEWLRSLKLPELPIRWDPQVLRYLDYFKSDPKGRAIMSGWLRRLGRFRNVFEGILAREGVPKDLVYLAMIESGFETASTSRVGAGGLWQFMPGAARAYGLEVSYWVDGRRDPERSTEAAARYLKDLYVRFGSWHLAFAAYNAGYGAVLKSITRYNTNDYWELCRHEAGLPWESSIYVPKILAAAIVGHNLAAFGYGDLAIDPPFAYDRVSAPTGTTLATVARAAATRLDVVQSLNPELVRNRLPPDRPAATVRIPFGTTTLYSEGLDRSRSAADQVETVVLRFGETIDDVARVRQLTPKELRRLNGVKDSSDLRAGLAVVVPKRAPATPKAGSAAPEGEGDADEEESTIVALPDRVFSYEGRERVFYKTRDGDGIEEIADTFHVTAADLVEWNNLDPDAKLHARMILQVFVRKDFDPAAIVLLDPSKVRVVTLGSEEFLELEAARRGKKRLFYAAKAGDTLAKVGRRYGLTPGDLARINRFSYNTELQPGQKIVVYSPTGELPREATLGRAPVDSKRPAGKQPPLTALGGVKAGSSSAKSGAPGKTTAPARPGAKVSTVAAAKPTQKPAAAPKPKSSVPALPQKKR